MELTLAHQTEAEITVTCDGQHSHTFDVRTLSLNSEKERPHPLDDLVAYGEAVYLALFPPGTRARYVLEATPERILLVTTANDLDAISWEYAYGPDGFLVLECHFVRGLPTDQRIAPPTLDTGLHIIAVPSNPLSHELEPLNIDEEWIRLKEIIQQVPHAITLERTRPPTIEQVRTLVANQRHRVVHFMGHGGQDEQGALLYFEQEIGDLDPVTASQFVLRVRGSVFLVLLNACVTATPGPTPFSNLADALVRHKVPYAMGMRFTIDDEDARAFAHTFYRDLAHGSSVEEALFQARLTFASSLRRWVVGVPVLYTSLTQPSAGFVSRAGTPIISEYQPRLEVSALPRAEGTFQGRVDELKQLGTILAGDSYSSLVTIHGGGGQGKTALAREVAERFAYVWPGGVWATSLEPLPNRELFVNELAHFLGIDIQRVLDPKELEHRVMARLVHSRTLIVLDNAETLVEAVAVNNEEAVRLAQFIREQLARPPVSLLATSRSFLGWNSEIGCELTGLAPIEGIRLFKQYTAQREKEVDQRLAWELSEKVEGHPLSLRLLGTAFNVSSTSLSDFIREYEAYLLKVEDKYKDIDHRQRTLYASIETSVRYLDSDLRTLLSGLWIFQAPFLPETAVALFDLEAKETEQIISPVLNRLHTLWQQGLLIRKTVALGEEILELYSLSSTTRLFVEKHLKQFYELKSLQERFGIYYTFFARNLYNELHKNAWAVAIAQQIHADIEQASAYVVGEVQGYYLLFLGWILYRLGYPELGLKRLENALEITQGLNRGLEALLLNTLGTVYKDTGQLNKALIFCEQSLPIMLEVGDQAGEAAVLNNIGEIYRIMGQWQQALTFYEKALIVEREVSGRKNEADILNNMSALYWDTWHRQKALTFDQQALSIRQEIGDRVGEATSLHNMARIYQGTGQLQQALQLYEQALPIMQQMNDRRGEAAVLSGMAGVYKDAGQLQQALKLYEQALLNMRQMSDHIGEAEVLRGLAGVYRGKGILQQALTLYEQALRIEREVGDRGGEAVTLSDMGVVYRAIRQPRQALTTYEEALCIRHEIGDRGGEAITLNNMVLIYKDMGQHEHALSLCQRALLIHREVSNRAGEATTLSNMALLYQEQGLLQHALTLYEQVLPILREVGNRAGEAIVLSNAAHIYQDVGQLQKALDFYKEALLIEREIGDRASEEDTLYKLAQLLQFMHLYLEALAAYEQAVILARQMPSPSDEVADEVGLALLHYRHLNKAPEAISHLEQAIAILRETGLPQDAAGRTLDDLQGLLQIMRTGGSLSKQEGDPATMPAVVIQQIISNTIAVMTTARNHYAGWCEAIASTLQDAQQVAEGQMEVDFFAAVLDILNGGSPTLGADHPYAEAVAAIQHGIATGRVENANISLTDGDVLMQAVWDFINTEDWVAKRQVLEAQQSLLFQPEVEAFFEVNIVQAKVAGKQRAVELLELHLYLLRASKANGITHTFKQLMETQEDDLLINTELIPRTIAALSGNPQEKMAHMQYLIAQASNTSDENLKGFLKIIQLAMFSNDLSELGQDLNGIYRQVWETIVASVEAGGTDPRVFDLIIRNTLAVLGPASHERGDWRKKLAGLCKQAAAQDDRNMVALLDEVIGLLDAGDNPVGLGEGLKGIYAKTWQAIIEGLSSQS